MLFLNLIAFGSLAAATPLLRVRDVGTLVGSLRGRDDSNVTAGLQPYGSVFTAESPRWTSVSERWSTWSPPTFGLVFVPTTEEDVSQGLEYMSSQNVPYLAKGGGHGNSLTLANIQNGVMINMESFDKIVVNSDKTITVGGGVVFGDVYEAAYQARRELNLGSCPCVGVTGATLGGGHGRLQGKYGLSADALVKVRMALWNGTILEASADKNPELFWGMRGAGHNFGVVLESTFKTWPQENNGQHYNADMTFSSSSLEGMISVINSMIPDLDAALALDLFFYTDPTNAEPVIFLNIVYAGVESKGRKFADKFATTSKTAKLPIERLSFAEDVFTWNELPSRSAAGLISVACTPGARNNIYSANTAHFDVAQTREIYEDYVQFVKENPKASNSIVFYEIFGQQAVRAQKAKDTAVGNRDQGNILALVEAIYTDDSVADAGEEWARKARDMLVDPKYSGYDKESVYQNYAHGDEKLEALYGYEPWRLSKLRSLKQRYDPHGFFSAYHSVS